MNTIPALTDLVEVPSREPLVTAGAELADLDLVGASVESRCAYYQQVCQMPAMLDPTSDQIIFVAGRVQAVMVPWALGQRVRSELDRADAGCGPIVSHPKSESWTFITQSDRRIDSLPDDTLLWVNNVVVMASGVRIGLPTPTATNADPCRVWELPPTSPQRPTTTTVLDAVRTCLKRGETR
ncbi:DNA-directed RNA polymerase subunit beta [Nocardia sp. NPDC058497]|uniref:DNA-directed RNA polymerase subunit beta n=1 Tax=Nocardia sp. NPDC058497 TaxID=3346529 RepID=UPI003649D3D9